MNVHKSIIGMGFRKCKPHKIKEDYWDKPSKKMVLNQFEYSYKTINGKQVRVEQPIKFEKYYSFYCSNFSDNLIIWIDSNHKHITNIWIEGDIVEDGVEKVFNHNQSSYKIANKNDIVKLLPKIVQRDFFLSLLFK